MWLLYKPMKLYVGYTLFVIAIMAILAGVVALTSKTASTLVLPPTNPKDCPNVLLRKGNRLLLINTEKPTVDGINPMFFNNLEDYVAYAKQQNTISKTMCPLLFLQQDDDEKEEDTLHCIEKKVAVPPASPSPSSVQKYLPPPPSTTVFPVPPTVAPVPMSPMQTVPPVPRQLPNPVPPQQQAVSFPFPPTTTMKPYIAPTLPSSTATMTIDFTKRNPAPYVDASRDDSPFNQNMYPGFDPINLYTGVYTTIDAVHYSTRQPQPNTPFSDNAMDPNWGGVQYTRAQVNSGKYDENTVDVTQYSAPPNTFMIPSMRPLVDPAAAPANQAPLTSLLSKPLT